MASTADELVTFYARALPGEIFRYPRLSPPSATPLVEGRDRPDCRSGSTRLSKGGSLDAFSDHVLSAAGGMYVAQRWVYFAVILNWSDDEGGSVASVGPTFTSVVHAAFTMIRDRLGA